MIREGHNEVSFFTGVEVEHTPAYGLKTLFVVGVQDVDSIAANLQGCEHIYFGANQSFPKLDINDADGWSSWEKMIEYFLKKDYLCTLDIDVQCTEGLLESGLTERHNFIPMISVKLPYIDQLGYNATLKLDDKDFRATNPGVWCHSIHSLKNRRNFTDWSKYTKDSVL
ncbi:hypothetical protein UFOVP1636_134 [uncultured Caudovirales phage]|uniref:Uncharacterized protein n=1 Tax=uncultured Caudovirales phage TaxID=2100421 RepID=A0A6J5T363_9CAUD|nr:hypothetical protein UFOVP1636_134 [uncultured Caudovirales phage]